MKDCKCYFIKDIVTKYRGSVRCQVFKSLSFHAGFQKETREHISKRKVNFS